MKRKKERSFGAAKAALLALVASVYGLLAVSRQTFAVDVGIAKPREDWLTELGNEIARETGEASGVAGRGEQTPRHGDWGQRENLITMCVDLSDGYFFPTPNSGYNSRSEIATIMLQCRIICKTDNVDVFVVQDIAQVRDSMVSLTSNDRYTAIFSSSVNLPKSNVCSYQNYFEFMRMRHGAKLAEDN